MILLWLSILWILVFFFSILVTFAMIDIDKRLRKLEKKEPSDEPIETEVEPAK